MFSHLESVPSFLKEDTSEDRHGIYLVDISNSVRGDYRNATILDQEELVVLESYQKYKSARLLFWCSPQLRSVCPSLETGVFAMDLEITQDKDVRTLFEVVRSLKYKGLTYTHLAFEKLPRTYLRPRMTNTFILVTDGQIGYHNIQPSARQQMYNSLVMEWTKVKSLVCQAHLKIHTVENQDRDVGNTETLQNMAGCDVWEAFRTQSSLDTIHSFIVDSRNGRQCLFEKSEIPAGCAGFGKYYFHLKHSNLFYEFVKELVLQHRQNLPILLQIIQNLGGSLFTLTEGRSVKFRKDLVLQFALMFTDTDLSVSMGHQLLQNSQSAALLQDVHQSLKDKYKAANQALFQDVRFAIGLFQSEEVVTFPPVEHTILCVPSALVTANVHIAGKLFPNGAFCSGRDTLWPCIPLRCPATEEEQQALRQWCRALVHQRWPTVRPQSYLALYLTLGLILRTCLTCSDSRVLGAYKALGKVMLGMKKEGSQTKWDWLKQGKHPMTNSDLISDFGRCMETVQRQLNFPTWQPMTLWFLICFVLGLDDRQRVHCEDDLRLDNMTNVEMQSIFLPPPSENVVRIQMEDFLERECPILLTDTTLGGYRIKRHIGNCEPRFVFSKEAYDQYLLESLRCPICQASLNEQDLIQVQEQQRVNLPTQTYFSSKPQGKIDVDPQPLFSPQDLVLVMMHGVVGSGKTTYSNTLRDLAEPQYNVLVQGMDMYTVQGLGPREGAAQVKEAVTKFCQKTSKDQGKPRMLIIDVCGENSKASDVFGVNLSFCTKVFKVWPNLGPKGKLEPGYLEWSLCNVLNRTSATSTSLYNLNPDDAGVDTCVRVHRTKTKRLFGKKKQLNVPHLATKKMILDMFQNSAQAFSPPPIIDQVRSFLSALNM